MAEVVKAGFWYCKDSQQRFEESTAPTYFTHLFCAFASISSSSHEVIIPVQYQDTFEHFNDNAKEKKPGIKTFISIGGPDTDSKLFPSLVSNKKNRTALINSSINLAQSHNFDGLDFFWPCEYPATQEDVINLGFLFDEWCKAKKNILLSATVFYTPVVDNLPRYPIDPISNLDFINVRAYGFYDPRSSWSITGPPATIYNRKEQAKCVDSGIKNWMQLVPKSKLVLGLPFVGFEWLLADPDYQPGLFARANGPASTGIGHDGLIFYRDIITKAGFHQAPEPDYETVYCYDSTNWIGYDNPEIIKKKIQYAKTNGLLGYFGWHVGADDRDWTLSRTASDEWDKPDQEKE